MAYYIFWFRAFACFNLVMIGLGMFIAGGPKGYEGFFRIPGLIMFLVGIGILYGTSLKCEKSRRFHYMKELFLYGMFLFLKMIMYTMIITIPLGVMLKRFSADYREAALVDSMGRHVKNIMVTDEGCDVEGNRYQVIDNDPY